MQQPDDISSRLHIKGFVEVSLLDYPHGKPGAVIFLGGCDLRCAYCQASQFVTDIGRIPSISLDDVLRSLSELRGFVRGVTLTGGEVTLHSGLDTLLSRLRGLGYPVKLDTWGARTDRIDRWIRNELIQALAIDVKGPWHRYDRIVGQGRISEARLNQLINWISRMARTLSVQCEFRTTIHPQLLTLDEVLQTAEQIRGAQTYVLQNYRRVDGFQPELQERKSYEDDELRQVASDIRHRQIVRRCFLRGYENDDREFGASDADSD